MDHLGRGEERGEGGGVRERRERGKKGKERERGEGGGGGKERKKERKMVI